MQRLTLHLSYPRYGLINNSMSRRKRERADVSMWRFKEKERTFARRRTKAPNLAEILAASSLSRDCGAPRRSFNGGHYCAGASINCIRASPVALYVHVYKHR